MQKKEISKRFSKRTHRLLLVWLCLLLGSTVTIQNLTAQADWSTTETLFDPDAPAMGLYLIADNAGYAHMAWLNSSTIRALYYSRWDGTGWTEPIDIFVVRAGEPVLVASKSGKLHIFWNTGADLYHSWAWIGESESLHAWAEPNIVLSCNEDCSIPIDVKQDIQGILHLTYAHREGDIYYTYSTDEGVSWMPPQPVSTVAPGTTTFMPRLAIADDDRIHVVWAEVQLPDGDYLRLNYAHSIDGGHSWTQPLEIGAGNQADGNLLTVGENEVHLAWNGGVGVGGRYYQYSRDGGVTWSEPVRISSLSGRAGYPSIVRDSVDNLHILTGDGEYATQTGNQWTTPQRMPFFLDYIEQSRLTIVNGNQLLAVTPLHFRGIYYSVKQLDIPAIPQRLLPEIPPTPTVSSAITIVDFSDDHLQTTPVPTFLDQPSLPDDRSPYSSLMIAFATALLVTVVGVALQFIRAK